MILHFRELHNKADEAFKTSLGIRLSVFEQIRIRHISQVCKSTHFTNRIDKSRFHQGIHFVLRLWSIVIIFARCKKKSKASRDSTESFEKPVLRCEEEIQA